MLGFAIGEFDVQIFLQFSKNRLKMRYSKRWAKNLIDRPSDSDTVFDSVSRFNSIKVRYFYWAIVTVSFKFFY
jgi:hypothetical protein